MSYDLFHQYAKYTSVMPQLDRIITGDQWRISLLSDSLVRLEWSEQGAFEDRPTQTVINRDLGGEIHAQITPIGNGVRIETPALRLDYDGTPFSRESLSIVVKGVADSQCNTWHYGEHGRGNLGGTARTLDEADGAVPIGEGILSRDGWAILDDSASNVMEKINEVNGESNPFGIWPVARENESVDIYVFAYGHRYIEAIHDYYQLTGSQPLLPRWALGNWWSRFYRYSQDEYIDLMKRFQSEGIPFTVAVLDMDWHITEVDPAYGSGWTGYTWNNELFPDPASLLKTLHDKGLHVTLNEHPRDGVRAFESQYAQMAQDMGIDPESKETIEFDPSSPRFLDAYLDMHHRIAEDGIDFWWVDWQQGGVTKQRGLDPLWMLNFMHYVDSGRDGRWPLTFSRYAGPGSHRYPIGFSGDTVISWKSLEFQPMFTASASNIGYGWWSHDIGGHMLGKRDDELEARWYQLGVFSPINRLHSSNSPFSGKEPWNFPEPVRSAMIDSLRLRHRLIPYTYSMNYRAAFENRPIVEPIYWQNPNQHGAYWYPNEYRFGSELIVAPITQPCDAISRLARVDVWLPQGEWYDFFDGRRYRAHQSQGRSLTVWRGIDRIPVFAQAGAIIPMQTINEHLNSVANPQQLEILAFPGADGEFVMTEDSGEWSDVCENRITRTQLRQYWNTTSVHFEITPIQISEGQVPHERDWTVIFRGVSAQDKAALPVVTANVNGNPVECAVEIDSSTLSLRVAIVQVPSDASIDIAVSPLQIAPNPAVEDCHRILLGAQMTNTGKDLAFEAVKSQGLEGLASLRACDVQPGFFNPLVESHVPESVIAACTEALLR